MDYYKSRIEELRQDYRVLEETKEMTEEQLAKAKKRADYAAQLESELVQLKRTVAEVNLERDAIQEKLDDLLEENTHLKLLNRNNMTSNSSKRHDDQFLLNDSSECTINRI